MPRESHVAWAAYTTEVEKSETRKGIVVFVKGWKCNFCQGSFWNKALDRVLGHVSCVKALCNKITPCSESRVPEDVRDAVRSEIAVKEGTKAAPTSAEIKLLFELTPMLLISFGTGVYEACRTNRLSRRRRRPAACGSAVAATKQDGRVVPRHERAVRLLRRLGHRAP
jgi:hypothetical protein